MLSKKRIGFIGNFKPLFSTENDRKWSFEKLGHEVIPLQENRVTVKELTDLIVSVDLLLYSHTHDPSYVIPGLIDVFSEYKKAGISTASIHLDLWRGLDRWRDVGKEATWFVDHIFTPDDTGEWPIKINHHYMRPGVKESSCYVAQPDSVRFPHEIIFVGSRGYHPEWLWRRGVIDWLQETYGNRFKLYGNDNQNVVRGHDLNVLISSSKIVVGDSCFGGEIKGYYSDRVPELTGRGALLLHPKNEYIKNSGVVQFECNLDSLKSKIDYYLNNPAEGEEKRKIAFEYTKANDNYTKISEEILKIIFG